MAVDEEVCIVTQPVSPASSAHIDDLVTIIGSITGVSLIAANLPDNHQLRDEIDVVDIASVGTGSAIPVAAWRFLRNQVRMSRHIRQRPESVIWFFGATSYLLPILVATLSGKTIVIQPRGDVPLSLQLQWAEKVPSFFARSLAFIIKLLEGISYRFADHIVVYTPSMADQLGLYRYESKLSTNGARFVDTDKFSIKEPFESRESTVGYVGRFDAEKRLPMLVQMAKNLPQDISMRFVGDGQYREDLETALADNIAEGSVTVTGWVDRDDLPVQYNKCTLVVVMSHPTEGLPTVILEAFACGTPVCANPVASIPDVVVDGETGLTIDTNNPTEMAQSIATLLSDDSLPQMSQNVREIAESRFSLDSAIRRYEVILTEVTA